VQSSNSTAQLAIGPGGTVPFSRRARARRPQVRVERMSLRITDQATIAIASRFPIRFVKVAWWKWVSGGMGVVGARGELGPHAHARCGTCLMHS
jgi:hypothetical protein